MHEPLIVITDHVDILKMCSAGMMGSQVEWPQLRPACREAAKEIQQLREQVKELNKYRQLINKL